LGSNEQTNGSRNIQVNSHGSTSRNYNQGYAVQPALASGS